MDRLFEELEGRLHEMALITARVLGINMAEAEIVMPLGRIAEGNAGAAEKKVKYKGVETVCSPTGCGYYDYDAKVCFDCG
jgi:hypothetical protein